MASRKGLGQIHLNERKFISIVFWLSLLLGTLAASFGTLAGFGGRLHWRLDLFSHFRGQYLLFLGPVALVFLAGKKRWQAALAGTFALVNLLLVLSLYAAPPRPPESAPVYRVLLANVYTPNQEHHLVRELIAAEKPDFVVLIEVNERWLDALRLDKIGYAHTISQPRDDNFGIALFSRHLWETAAVQDLGGFGFESVVARFSLAGQPLTLVGTHPPPPRNAGWTAMRNEQTLEAVRFAASQPGNAIVLGDLNITSWSPYFPALLLAGGLSDSRVGFGVQPSWPAHYPAFFRVPIDHILVSPGVNVWHREVGPEIGSDHLPIILDFSMP